MSGAAWLMRWASSSSARILRQTVTVPARNIRQARSRASQQTVEPQAVYGGFVPARNAAYLIRPAIFTVAGISTCFCGCAVWQYENHRNKSLIKSWSNSASRGPKQPEWRQQLHVLWNSLEDKKCVAAILALNCLVFGAWKVPRLAPLMARYFLASPFSARPCSSMLLSTFSHSSPLHLLMNMYVLWSFAPPLLQLLGPEHFCFAYLSGGLVASLASYALKVARVCPTYSLGASGAIMCLLGMVCAHFPDAQLAIAFVSSIVPHSFSAQSAMYGLITMDSLGVLLGWRMFDHAAHLGGLLFGVWYIKKGARQLWGRRHVVQKPWAAIRG